MEKRIEVRKSGIQGSGVFALQEIKMGETVHFMEGEICTFEEIVNRVNEGQETQSDPFEFAKEIYLDLDETSRTFNHSCNPNLFIKGKFELIALRSIEKGEEFTYDYSTTMNYNEEKFLNFGQELWTCTCNCGSENCRGIIDQFKTLPKTRQEYYIENKFMPDFMIEQFN
jgi:SET domain-containing protein